MFQLGFVKAMQADREREIKSAIRLRQLLRAQDGPTEPVPARIQTTTEGRNMAVRVRPTGG